ncbi:hypothetical protein F5X98DRAFT_379843 [Xylaria grammica]|nr:hypothetical protein F5X98DRAFT_379843 [Xylaria grammica]
MSDDEARACARRLEGANATEPCMRNAARMPGSTPYGPRLVFCLAEPGVSAGVKEHSNFAHRVTDRLRTTTTFMYAGEEGGRGHDRQSRREGRDKGEPYSALDPALQLWVAATLYATGISAYERFCGAIADEAEHDGIYFEYSILACRCRRTCGRPAGGRSGRTSTDRRVAALEVTQHARDVGAGILRLRCAPVYLRLLMPGVRVFTAAFLPERIRREYGLRAHPKTYKLLEWLIRRLYHVTPLRVRSYPVSFYMRDMRGRLVSRKKVFEKAWFCFPLSVFTLASVV